MENNLEYVKSIFDRLSNSQVEKIKNEKVMQYVLFDVTPYDEENLAISVNFMSEQGARASSQFTNDMSFSMEISAVRDLLKAINKY